MLSDRILSAHLPDVKKSNWSIEEFLRLRPRRLKPQLEFELTDFIRALALLVRNGVPIVVAIAWLVPRISGKLAEPLSVLRAEIELGAPIADALEEFAQSCNSALADELVQKILVSQERGTPLADQLEELVLSAQAAMSERLLRQAGSNETKMLIPTIFVILPVTVLFAVYPSLSLIGSGF